MKRIISLLLVLALLTGNLAPAAALEATEATAVAEESAVSTTTETVPVIQAETLPETTESTVPETPETTEARELVIEDTAVSAETIEVEIIESDRAENAEIIQEGTCGDNLSWTLDMDGLLTISGSGEIDFFYEAPWFGYEDQITTVKINSGVTGICDYAFSGCLNMTSVTIPAGVTRIGNGAFSSCSSLTSVALPNGVVSLGDWAFSGCENLTSVTIPASVTSIGDYAFRYCTSLIGFQVADGNSKFSSDSSGALFNKNKTTLLYFPGGYSGAYTVPSSVTSVADCAFYCCNSLTSVVFSYGVTSIGNNAFSACEALTSVTFPSSLTTIHDYAFQQCGRLNNLSIPASVTSIGEGAFRNCTSLTKIQVAAGNSVYTADSSGVLYTKDMTTLVCCPGGYSGVYTIPNGVTKLKEQAFFYCVNLTGVTIPASVTAIGSDAFYYCRSLSSVHFAGNAPSFTGTPFYGVTATAYYPAGNATWTGAVMQNYGGSIAWTAYTVGGDLTQESTIMVIDNEDEVYFDYYSTIEEYTVNYKINYYDESWFFEDSTFYNHDLARMSVRMAMAAARKTATSIDRFFDVLKLDHVEEHYPTPSSNTIGYAIGSKEITDETGQTIRLITVAVRGGGYGAEWADNFRVGISQKHTGFSTAADTVVSAVKAYLKERSDSGIAVDQTKIWMTGFSRAAAVTNLAAHQLTYDAWRGLLSDLDVEDIFAYCIACPSGVRTDDSEYSTLDKNIFSIVNPVDFVPMVTPKQWDFSRYGITYYLPSNEDEYNHYKTASDRMEKQYSQVIKNTGTGKTVSDLVAFDKAQQSNLENIIETLTNDIGSQRNYYNSYQDTVMGALAQMNGEPDIWDALDAFLVAVPAFGLRHPIATSKLVKFGVGGYISRAHYPELYLSWMDALDGTELKENARTRYLIVNCPVDLSVYDSNGVLVAKIAKDEVQEIADSTIGAYLDENGQKIVALPFDEDFTIEVTATDNGTMSCQIAEYDIANGETTRVINYYDIPIEEGDILTGTAASSDGSSAAYTLLDPDDQEIAPSNALTASEIGNYTVTISALGNGTVAGGGLYVTGEFAKLMAEAEEGENFLGWYEGDTLLSADVEYRFRVEADREIVGKFTKNTNGDLNGDSLTDAQDVTHLVWHLLFSETFPLTNDADFDCDGDVDLADAADLLWQVLFPVTQ